ncbi:MAG: acetyl-CoA carboxylase biotin carboxylase subunit [Fimbriimonadales bacterium]
MLKKVLIANRGEIACRIIRACHKLGIKAVAVYSTADSEAMHVKMADDSVCVGPGPNSESYLNMPNVLMAAITKQCDAIHPGYGYFSEQSQFADACQALGIKFIGPPVEAIARMGDKAAAREAAIAAQCPVVPGSDGCVEDVETAAGVAESLGYPVLVKAAAGGGGRGIRRVESADDLEAAFKIASQEALASFGNGDLYVEKLVVRPRHVEVQLLGDAFGNCVYLGERECSVQNLRHQKMIEEAPFAQVSPDIRRQMGEASVRLAKSVGYANAGTIEFLMDASGAFYFIEMNTRLQVEHPVTEQITGIDIVEQMLRVASGEELKFQQPDITYTGHAIELRITAQDASRDFAPSCGKVVTWRPPKGDHIRMESHIYEGFEVSPFYDPMIAKLIITAGDRNECVRLIPSALDEFAVEGIKTNIPFLKTLVGTPGFLTGDVHTSYVAEMFSAQEVTA